ncbi:pentapeptide repeat-containing protein [Sinomonas atrocyanea]
MLNNSGAQGVNEDQFRRLIEDEFDKEIRRRGPERRSSEIESYFDDLRRSGSLSRRQAQGESIWTFSHNSIREFLAAQRMVDKLASGDSPLRNYAVTDAMRIFVSSLADDKIREQCTLLSERWPARASNPGLGSYVVLLWDALAKVWGRECVEPLERITGSPMVLEGLRLSRIDFARGRTEWSMMNADFRSSELSSVNFSFGLIVDTKFSSALLDGISFRHAALQGCNFDSAALLEVDLSDANMKSCSFKGLDSDSTIIVNQERLNGPAAIGYLRYLGCETDNVDDIYIWRNSSYYPIVEKIASKLLERPQRQRLGLTQKGASAFNPTIAEHFIRSMERAGHVRPQGGRTDIVELLPSGRTVFGNLTTGTTMDLSIAEFLKECEGLHR